MNSAQPLPSIKKYWDRNGLHQTIRDALIASGKSLDTLTLEEVAPLDQFHGGGQGFTTRLARLANLRAEMTVLDVGGGLGGPARTLAAQFGCQVTVLDLAESYARAGRMLTDLLRLHDRVIHRVGSALALPFGDHSFEAVWTQNSGMNIGDKAGLYAEIRRVLRPGGLLATQEPMSGPNQPAVFPVMWSRDGTGHFLQTPEAMRALIEARVFRPASGKMSRTRIPRRSPPACRRYRAW